MNETNREAAALTRNETRQATLSDVARLAGVSKMAVSVVVNGARSGTQVSEETRGRILEAAKTLRYRRNAIARSLTRRRSDIIGFYSGYQFVNLRTLFMTDIVMGLQEGCEQVGKDLLVHALASGDTADSVLDKFSNGMIDGLVLYSPPGNPLIQRLADSHLPVVALADVLPSIPSVVVDDAGGARMLAAHMAERGYRRVLMTAHSHEDAVSIQRRRAAFCALAPTLGLRVTACALADLDADTRARLGLCVAGGPPAVVLCWSDGEAYRILGLCRKHGLRVPQDIAVAGFDGVVPPVPVWRDLTTVRAGWCDVARAAVALVTTQIDGKEAAQETVLPVTFVPGETT